MAMYKCFIIIIITSIIIIIILCVNFDHRARTMSFHLYIPSTYHSPQHEETQVAAE